MGCFCRHIEPAPIPPDPVQEDLQQDPHEVGDSPRIEAVGQWLAARWLPAPRWEPDPEWQDEEWPESPVAPEALAVLTGLFVAQQSCRTALQIDPAEPLQVDRLTRIVGTLNRRKEQLQQWDEDRRPWAELAQLNDQADLVQRAVQQQVFEPPQDQEPEEPLGPWRRTLAKIKALSPLVAIAQLQQVDFDAPDAVETLAEEVRKLRRVTLPPLEDPGLVLRLITRIDAVARLRESLGADPRPYPFERVKVVVERKVQEVLALLPERVQLQDGLLTGMPQLQPNPSLLVNQATVAAIRKLKPKTLERLRWKVPPYAELPLLTVGATVAALVGALTKLGPSPVRVSPCGQECDAGSVMRTLTALRGSGTDAVPAG